MVFDVPIWRKRESGPLVMLIEYDSTGISTRRYIMLSRSRSLCFCRVPQPIQGLISSLWNCSCGCIGLTKWCPGCSGIFCCWHSPCRSNVYLKEAKGKLCHHWHACSKTGYLASVQGIKHPSLWPVSSLDGVLRANEPFFVCECG